MQAALEFLEIPRKQWSSIVRSTVQASVEALTFMCKLRFSPSSQNSIFDTDDQQSYLVERTADWRFSRKRKAVTTNENLFLMFQRWSKILPLSR